MDENAGRRSAPVPGVAASRRRPVRRAVVVMAALGLVLAACSGSSSDDDAGSTTSRPPGTPSTSSPSATSSTTQADAGAWSALDRDLGAIAPEVSLLAAEVTADGPCEPVHELAADVARPIGSQFKLYVLGALADAVADGSVRWDEELRVDADIRSLGNGEGSLQFAPDGASVTVEDAARKMIGISDNTATDLLMRRVGRDAVEATAADWMVDSAANEGQFQ